MEVEASDISISPNMDLDLIYKRDFFNTGFNQHIVRAWERVQLLEQVLQSRVHGELTFSEAMLTIAILNAKQLEQIQVGAEWIGVLFKFILKQEINKLSLEEKQQIYTFLMQVYCFPEIEFVHEVAYKQLSSGLLVNSNKIFLKSHFLRYPDMIPEYIKASKSKALPTLFPELIEDAIAQIWAYPVGEVHKPDVIAVDQQQQFRTYLERNTAPLPIQNTFKAQNEKLLYRMITTTQIRHLKCIEKLVDLLILLLSSIPTRKYLRIYLLSTNLLPYLKCSILPYHSCILYTLVEQLEHYLNYPLNDQTGEPLSYTTQSLVHKDFLKKMQIVLYKQFNFMVQQKELEEFQFVKNLRREELETLFQLMTMVFPQELPIHIYSPNNNFDSLVLEIMRTAFPLPTQHSYLINKPLIPDETLIWDYKIIPEESRSGILKQALALPKLNLQFLCFDDYLERNFKLFKFESAFDLRKDLEDVIIRMDPQFDNNGLLVNFKGWAKMASTVTKFRIHEIQTPEIGDLIPRKVYGEVQYNVTEMSQQVRKEWDSLQKHQVVFLISFKQESNVAGFLKDYNERMELIDKIEENEGCKLFCEKYGIRAIRGAEIALLYDERRREILDWEEADPAKKYQGELRILHVLLDPAQYQMDVNAGINAEGEIYGNFKLIVRRNPKENNFKSILSSIQQVVINPPKLPSFLENILLGYGKTDVSSSTHFMNTTRQAINLRDTIIDHSHLDEILYTLDVPQHLKSQLNYQTGKNKIRFTAPQVKSIIAAMHPGITLVVGPPGTGKTDITIQIINLLYQNHPEQKTLIITHSNHALNDIFEKISTLDIDEMHLLRLGIGAKDLKLSKVYSREGRIDHMLKKRIDLLDIVSNLQKAIEIPFAEEYSCQVADLFFKTHIQRLWQQKTDGVFPFTKFVEQYPNLFRNALTPEDQYQVIVDIFEQINQCRPFELLRNKKERGHYVICHQARIVAMTCTHAALKRNMFYEQDFQYDNIIFEEAGQILEIEAFLPLTMTKTGQVKRLIMIGDHNQLPPVIKNVSFQKIANMEQSFFIRMIRLGVTHHTLLHQGRTRSEILPLYQWKYPNLSSLPLNFRAFNPGFNKVLQFINVNSHEQCPIQYFYQNIEEAEFICAVYMYLMLLGYDNKKITILTTYNGQKLLIKDIINRKCSWHSLFRSPDKITTVDKFQGQQNDIILLSMVRTTNPGYLRDIRRIIVAFSRAKLGLYIFGKYSVFNSVPELQNTFKHLTPEALELIPNEKFSSETRQTDIVRVENSNQMYSIVKEKLLQQA